MSILAIIAKMNNLTVISASDLKKHTAEILNLVYYGRKTALVKRHGIPLVDITPTKIDERGGAGNITSLKLIDDLSGSVALPNKFEGKNLGKIVSIAKQEHFRRKYG